MQGRPDRLLRRRMSCGSGCSLVERRLFGRPVGEISSVQPFTEWKLEMEHADLPGTLLGPEGSIRTLQDRHLRELRP